jgi:predicted Zn-ribbon and HTH transcriptional regulator/DNA-binding phage protein
MATEKTDSKKLDIEKFIKDVLGTIEQEREREIISRRYGLFDRKETLEQIGELLGITRERVRQLEKSIVQKLAVKAAGNQLPHLGEIEGVFTNELKEMGGVSRISDLSAKLTTDNNRLDQARIAFLVEMAPNLTLIEDTDHLYQAVSLTKTHDINDIKKSVDKIIAAVTAQGEPVTIDKVAEVANVSDVKEARALASISKQLATLNGRWGLVKWPMVNPKNIRDKIYVTLKENGKPMHFNQISEAIKDSTFKRKDVTTQAIHNELIKDKRFVLIGRGIYALKEWGYDKGTVSDIITEVLRKEGKPLHRDEIVKRVLKSRLVKETTILLNLQGKSQFKRVAKATYELAE